MLKLSVFEGKWFLKVLALIAAIVTYFYIANEIETAERKEKKVFDPSYKLIKLTAQDLPVKVRLATSAPDGYRILADQVTSTPKRVVVIGPEALLTETSSAETALVDVSENTKTFSKNIPLESVAGIHLSGQPYSVQVTVPVEKIENK